MNARKRQPGTAAEDFRIRSTWGVALTSVLLLTPFSVNNFLQGRDLLGLGSAAIVAVLAFNAWASSRGRYYPLLTLFALLPAVLAFLVVAFQQQGVIGALWCYPAVLAFYFMLPERQAWLANIAVLAVALPQGWQQLDHELAARLAATLAGVSVFSAIFVRVISGQQERLQALAMTDPLTGLANRTLLTPTLEHAVEQHRRSATPMSVLALDLDHFKAINDDLGHDAGDRVLRGVGALLRNRMRGADQVFRLGGEEFLVLLYSTDAPHARRVAEALRQAVADETLLADRPVTTSVGVATLREGEDWRTWMKRSDQNLYQAKARGRNCVMA